jgi:hypothetical protein
VRITIREGDIEQHGDSGQLTERAELDSGKFPLMNRDMWYGFSFLIPSDFPIVDRRLVIAQWKQSGLPGSPLVAQRFRGGRHHLTIRAAGFMGRGAGRHFELPGITAGQWHDMVYHIRFSPDGDGVVEVWMNGARAVVYEGATAMPGGSEIYNKIGLYRDRWKDPMTIYFDDYRLGGSSVDVSPH